MSSGRFEGQQGQPGGPGPEQQGWPGPGAPGQQSWPGPGAPGQYDQPGQYGQPGQHGAPGQYGQPGQPGAFGPGGSGWQPGAGSAYPYGGPGGNWANGPRRTNSLAIAALCCGIAQVAAGPFAGIPAIVLGSMSLKQIRQTGEDGHGMAVTGIALGIVGTLLAVIGIVVFIAVWNRVSSQTGY